MRGPRTSSTTRRTMSDPPSSIRPIRCANTCATAAGESGSGPITKEPTTRVAIPINASTVTRMGRVSLRDAKTGDVIG